MKKQFLLLLLLFFIVQQKSFAQYEGTFGMGAHLGYASEIQRPGIGLDLHYYVTNNFRIAPSFTYYMQIKNKRMWNINGDIHYVVPIGTVFSFYPLAGLHFSEWKNKSKNITTDSGDVYNSRLGINVGLGFQYDFMYKSRTSLEIKYQSIKDYSQVAIMLGIGFWI